MVDYLMREAGIRLSCFVWSSLVWATARYRANRTASGNIAIISLSGARHGVPINLRVVIPSVIRLSIIMSFRWSNHPCTPSIEVENLY